MSAFKEVEAKEVLFVFSVLGMELGASHMLGKCSTTEPHRQQREDKGKNVEDQHKMF
jgi:hypothetical protein